MTAAWPPPAKPADEVKTFNIDDAAIPARRVRLWGQPVWINAAGDVFCPGSSCQRFIPVADLGAFDNTHAVGLPPRSAGALLPIGDDTTSQSAFFR